MPAGLAISTDVSARVCLLNPPQLPEPLPGTARLTTTGDLAMDMVAGIDKYLLRQTDASIARRDQYWHRDFSSVEAYLKSVEPTGPIRQDHRGRGSASEALGYPVDRDDHAARRRSLRADDYTVDHVRWPVLDGVDAEGLLLQPKGKPVARVVAMPDADWTPEMLAGLASGVDPACQFARRLAENGCQVLVPCSSTGAAGCRATRRSA